MFLGQVDTVADLNLGKFKIWCVKVDLKQVS